MHNENINILQLISSLEVGGAEKLLIEQLKSSKKLDLPVNYSIVIVNDLLNEQLKEELVSIGYNVYFLHRKENSKNPRYFFDLFNIIRKNKINIIHSHDPGCKKWEVIFKLLNPKLKTVFTIHDTNIVKSFNKFHSFISRYLIDKNIAISKSVYDECINNSHNNVVQINNGVDVGYFSKNKAIIDKNNSKLDIINVSRITHTKKGQDILIKALIECKKNGLEFSCKFVGGVSDHESFEYLKQLVEEGNISDNVQFLGNRNDISELLAGSNLFILPSRYEGFGLVVIEAMAAGLPVIASNIDGPAEIIQNNKNGLLFESENYNDLVDKITYFYYNRDNMIDIALISNNYASSYDISLMTKKYYSLYKELS
ncbi:MAG: glycosyltransferase [bacterium]